MTPRLWFLVGEAWRKPMKVVEKMEKKRKGENGGEEAIFIGRNYEARRKGASLVHGCWPLPSRIMKNL